MVVGGWVVGVSCEARDADDRYAGDDLVLLEATRGRDRDDGDRNDHKRGAAGHEA